MECPGCYGELLCVPEASCGCPVFDCPPPPTCGGFGGLVCPDGMCCDFPDNGCGFADGLGYCAPIPDAWIEIYAPVCGCDGVTCGNEGEAHGRGDTPRVATPGATVGTSVQVVYEDGTTGEALLTNILWIASDATPEPFVCPPGVAER